MALVEIAIPRRPAYVRLVRLALASLARSSGLSEEAVEDLKIAVGEACANAVLTPSEAAGEGSVKIRWSDEQARIVIEFGEVVPGGRRAEATNGVDSSGFSTRLVMSAALLETLVDDCELVHYQDGRMYARLVVDRSSV